MDKKEIRSAILKLEMDPKLASLCRGVAEDFREEFDAVIGVEGAYGSGKTTLSWEIGANIDPEFSLDPNMIPGQAKIDAIKKLIWLIDNLAPFSAIVADEAQDIAHKQDWYSHISKVINRKMGKARKKFKAIILNISDITEFNRYFRKDRIDYYLEIISRDKASGKGLGVAWYKDRTKKSDVWRLEEREKRLDEYFKGWDRATIGPKEILAAYQTLPNFGFSFWFPRLPDEVYAHYLEFIAKQPDTEDLEVFDEPVSATTKKFRLVVAKLMKLMIDKNVMNQEQLAEYCDWSKAQVNGLLKLVGGRPIDGQLGVPDLPADTE